MNTESDSGDWSDDELAVYEEKSAEIRFAHETMREKAHALLAPVLGEETFRLESAKALQQRALSAFANTPPGIVHDVVFHLTDWRRDAACLLAVASFPDQFTPAEVHSCIVQFLVHAPDHVAAAARLSGHSIRDTFGLGLLVAHPGEFDELVLRP